MYVLNHDGLAARLYRQLTARPTAFALFSWVSLVFNLTLSVFFVCLSIFRFENLQFVLVGLWTDNIR